MTVHRTASPRDRWLACNPGKTTEDWGELVKRGRERVYMSDEERRRRARERKRLSRTRAKRRREELEAENAKLRELVRDMAAVICVYDQCVTVDDCPPALPMFADKMRELGIEVDG